MMSWIVVHTQSSKEFLAKAHLVEQGFEVYLPVFKKTRKHARKIEEVITPLFPRYLFLKFNPATDQWRCVNGTRGVSYVLLHDNRPSMIPSQIIEGLMAEEKDGLVSFESLRLFMKGERVRIIEGAFQDYTGVVDSFDDKQRVQVLLNLLGRELSVTLRETFLEAA